MLAMSEPITYVIENDHMTLLPDGTWLYEEDPPVVVQVARELDAIGEVLDSMGPMRVYGDVSGPHRKAPGWQANTCTACGRLWPWARDVRACPCTQTGSAA